MKSVVIKFAITGLLFLINVKMGKLSSEYVKPEQVKKYEIFCINQSETEALLNEKYSKTTAKVLGVPIEAYNYSYTYQVNGITDSGDYTSTTLLNSLKIKVWYDKTNPKLSETSDPCVQFEKLKMRKTSDYSGWFSFLDLGTLILGAMFGMNAIKSLIRFLVSGKGTDKK